MSETKKIQIRKVHLTCANGLEIYVYDQREGDCVKQFIDNISASCSELTFFHNVDIAADTIPVDVLIQYCHIPVCVVKYAADTARLEWMKNDLPLILKNTGIPIGVIVNGATDNYYIYRQEASEYEMLDIDQLITILSNECSSIPLELDLLDVKQILIKTFDNSDDFPNKANTRKVFYEACDSLSYKNGRVLIPVEYENLFFKAILGDVESNRVCRYTSLYSLFLILQNEKLALNGIASMNDSTEGVYADSKMPWSVQRTRGEVEIDNDNSAFLLCCCEEDLYDDLTMWRLYGDDSKGVCIRFTIDKSRIDNEKFFLSPVNYGRKDGTHPELNVICELCSTSIKNGWHFGFGQWFFWKYCFKPYEYAIEKEIRLVYFPDCSNDDPMPNWYMDSNNGVFNKQVLVPITYRAPFKLPLSIEDVILGPKSPNADKNVEQIWLMGQYLIDNVEKSKIDNYR